jgi:hypothetical protein
MKMCAEKPCPTCPWLKSSKVGGEDIKNFDIELMRELKKTVPPEGTEDDGFYTIMACHHSKEEKKYACAGYIATHGFQNLNVRILAAQGEIDVHAVISNCEGLELYDNFHTMLEDYEDAQN